VNIPSFPLICNDVYGEERCDANARDFTKMIGENAEGGIGLDDGNKEKEIW
jgi:hypothetical protein